MSYNHHTVTEVLGSKHRMIPSILYQAWATVGGIALSIVAYFLRNHFTIQLYMGLSPLVFLGYYWYVVN